MPYWLFEIIFWTVILAPLWYPVLVVMGLISFVDKLTAEPSRRLMLSRRSRRPRRKQHDLKMLAGFLQMRQNAQNH